MKKCLFPLFLLIAYCAILVKVMVFKDVPTIKIGRLLLNFSGTDSGHAPNFIPFKTILPYLLGHKGLIIGSINLIGNIILLIPVGLLVPLVYRDLTWKTALMLAIASGLTIEVMQVVLHVGIFDIDDILLNALGVMIGYGACVLFAKWIRTKNNTGIVTASLFIIVAASAGLYLIYPKGEQLVNAAKSTGGVPPDHSDPQIDELSGKGEDPCRGTGGTGQIMKVGNDTIWIRLNDGITKQVMFTDETKIRSSTGPISRTDLKRGERVTLVIDENETASLVLVCKVAQPVIDPGK